MKRLLCLLPLLLSNLAQAADTDQQASTQVKSDLATVLSTIDHNRIALSQAGGLTYQANLGGGVSQVSSGRFTFKVREVHYAGPGKHVIKYGLVSPVGRLTSYNAVLMLLDNGKGTTISQHITMAVVGGRRVDRELDDTVRSGVRQVRRKLMQLLGE